jgi:hypothetical protein
MLRKRIISYFFLLAAVLSILDGAFTLTQDMQVIKYVLLILAGVVVGLLHSEKKTELLRAGAATLVGAIFLWQIFSLSPTTIPLLAMVFNFMIFLASVVIAVGLEQVFYYLSLDITIEKTKKKKKAPKQSVAFDYWWSIIILLAVALTFIVLLIELFTVSSQIEDILLIIDAVITILFLIDLGILYRDSTSTKDFFKHNFFDILASIPTIGVFRALKVFRAIRIIKASKGTLRMIQLGKVHKTTKFFSHESSFNTVEKKRKKK